jgi:hypothetical protein
MLSIRNFGLRSPRNIFSGAMIAAVGSVFATGVQASLVISTAPTSNVSCTSTTCSQISAGDAVLNVTQLRTLLTSSSVEVNGRTKIAVDAEIVWASANTLTLNGSSVAINQPIAVAGSGGLTLELSNTEFPTFGLKGNVTFWSTSSNFTIIDSTLRTTVAYTLVNSIAMLASDIAAEPDGNNYALANSYNASSDGTYASSPIPFMGGNFIGLNNTISHLSIKDTVAGHQVGLFGTNSGIVSWLNLKNVHISGGNDSQVGAIAGTNDGNLIYDSAEGAISTRTGTNGSEPGAIAGGLVGLNNNIVEFSYNGGNVSGGQNAIIGGIAGENSHLGYNFIGAVYVDYSTADVSLESASCGRCSVGAQPNSAGGLVGVNNGFVEGYATGSVTSMAPANLGGLVGLGVYGASNAIGGSYSTGAVSGASGSSIGGAIGFDQPSDNISDVYWDTSTSGVTNSSQGAGNIANESGITGLTTTQLQSGLPAGFNPRFWGERPSINGGLPYLLAIPPRT